jgi:SpoVK/Ycf46/Vps4 family AAA+-type ATPase
VFGTLLTWMQETSAPVYVVATANDVRALKPELLRRFDDIFFVDLPDATSREAILKVHLEKRGRNFDMFKKSADLTKFVEKTHGFTGAEIEKVVKTAIEHAFFEKRELDADDLLDATARIIPISHTMSEQIADLKSWASGRAIQAGSPLEQKISKSTEKVSVRSVDLSN